MADPVLKSTLDTGDTVFINETLYTEKTIDQLKEYGYWYCGKILKDDSGIWILTQDCNSCLIENFETYWENQYTTVVWPKSNSYTTDAKNLLWQWAMNFAGKLKEGRYFKNDGDVWNDGLGIVYPNGLNSSEWPIGLINNDAANGSLEQYVDNLLMGFPMYNYPNWTGNDIFESVNNANLSLIIYE